jgi:hypothetical protein
MSLKSICSALLSNIFYTFAHVGNLLDDTLVIQTLPATGIFGISPTDTRLYCSAITHIR